MAVFTWIILAFGLGNVGLQESVSLGPQVLASQYLPTVALIFVAALIWAAATGLASRHTSREAIALLGVVLAADAVASILIAPALIGELTVSNSPTVFLVLTALGVQPLGVVIGGLGAVGWLRKRPPSLEPP